MRTVIVYVHGLWLGGRESLFLRRRLTRALGARCVTFGYPSVRGSLAGNVASLYECLRRIEADRLHVVAHSMGGLLVLGAFETGGAALPPGRIVLLGSPVRGSRAAARFADAPFHIGLRMLGTTAAAALLSAREPVWAQPGRELGVIAGDLGLGLGRVLGAMGGGANDGTVWVAETDLPGATAQLRLPVSHSGMLFSRRVAARVATFLAEGRF